MAAGNDVYEIGEGYNAGTTSYVLDATAGPTSSPGVTRRVLTTGGGIMTKSNLRTIAYFAIVGGVVCWMVAHLAPIRG